MLPSLCPVHSEELDGGDMTPKRVTDFAEYHNRFTILMAFLRIHPGRAVFLGSKIEEDSGSFNSKKNLVTSSLLLLPKLDSITASRVLMSLLSSVIQQLLGCR